MNHSRINKGHLTLMANNNKYKYAVDLTEKP